MTEAQFVLGIAYQANRDDRIRRAADGARDFFTPDELEKACHSFIKSLDSGIMHVDGTSGHVRITESYIYRGPDWESNGVLVKAGDWLVAGYLDDEAWKAVKDGRITGWSMQGKATRRRIRKDN